MKHTGKSLFSQGREVIFLPGVSDTAKEKDLHPVSSVTLLTFTVQKEKEKPSEGGRGNSVTEYLKS